MINILIPLAGGKSQFFPDELYPFPKPLIEFLGKTMIEHLMDSFSSIQDEKRFIFILSDEECKKYHLDNILNLLTSGSCKIITIDNKTKGAACSAIMAIDFINDDNQLIVSNYDQVIDINLQDVINKFRNNNCDAGVIIFDSIHPKWSYVKLDEKNNVVEAAEKKPISKNAIAGFYYFKYGKDFVQAVFDMIKKDVNLNENYYIAPSLNELVLKGKEIDTFKIKNDLYHTFYTPQKIKEYEAKKIPERDNK